MLLRSIRLENLLSFRDASLDLFPLNVLIGPNASGKSNLIDAISLLQGASSGLASYVMRRGDGVRGWIWKGDGLFETASLECRVPTQEDEKSSLRYSLRFTEEEHKLLIVEERLEAVRERSGRREPPVYFDRERENLVLRGWLSDALLKAPNKIAKIPPSESVLSVVKHPTENPEIMALGRRFGDMRFYRELNTGLRSQARFGVSAGGHFTSDYLSDGGDNLAPVLSRMNREASINDVKRYLHRFCERFVDVVVDFSGGIAQTYVREDRFPEPLAATRLSDGTLKFLCLLTILLHPSPPELVCIEEPELGLHPDALSIVAEALVEASERMQLIVTTHSEALVDGISDRPEAVIICEHSPESGTSFRRLDKKLLKGWLQRYTLGELWRKGEIGGNRW